MKLQANQDSQDIPFEGEPLPPSDDSKIPTDILVWINKFPYEVLKTIMEDRFFCTFRCGEKRNNGTEYRRLRISIDLSPWRVYGPLNEYKL